MDDLRRTYENLRRRAADQAERRAARVQRLAELARLQRELDATTRTRDPRDQAAAERLRQLEERIAAAAKAVDAAADDIRAVGGALGAALADFGTFADPVKQAARLDPATPLLLMPLRIETRFVEAELWVRIYPDQWAIDSFAPVPSEQEIENVRRFWTAWFRASGDDGMRRAAWRALVASHGSGRSEWLIDQHRPLDPVTDKLRTRTDEVILVVATDAVLTPPERTAAAGYWEAVWRSAGDPDGSAHGKLVAAAGEARAAVVLAAAPSNLAERPAAANPASAVLTVVFCTFPVVVEADTSTTSWSAPARVHVLPDRLVLLGFQGGAEVLHVAGKAIPPELAVGPDPAAGPGEQFRVVDGDLVVPDELRWMVDFDQAIDAGMALRIPLSAELQRGFDQLMVLGLRTAATPDEDQATLETLLTHHRRSRAGLAILRQGTPTNNTEGLPAGLDRLDDPDASYDSVFGGAAGLIDQPAWADKQDGQWLAECLGLDPAVIHGVNGAGLTDQAEARAMNTALWPATLGYFIETMMHPVLDDGDADLARAFFTDYVSGRGRVPALRIGRQPYGVLPVTVLSKLRPLSQAERAARPAEARQLEALHALLMRVASDWAGLAAAVPHVYAGTEPHQTLLDVVALHPASVEFHQRYARSLDDLFNEFGFEGLGAEFFTIWEALGTVLAGRQLLADLGYAGAGTPDLLGKLFHGAQHRLRGPVVDDRPLSESAPVRAYCDDGRNYLKWLADAAGTSLEMLRKEEGFSGGEEPTALLYLLLRHGLLLSWWDAAARLRLEAAMITPAQFRSAHAEPNFVHIAGDGPSESRWAELYGPAAAVTGNEAASLHESIPRLLERSSARHLAETIAAIGRLGGLPTSRLERLLAEHLDCCSHRADAWLGSLVTRRLLCLRAVHPTDTSGARAPARRGLHLGAFGWLEEVRPEARRLAKVALSDQLAAVFARPGEGPVLHDRANGGHVHAPSLDHGTTAAILRSGFLANATPAHPDTLAVNLSSGRMRLAVGVLQGLRNGQNLGALLGYRFERGLHDRHRLAEVDAFIHPLRLAFPSAGDRDGRLAIDGLELVRHMQSSGVHTYPFGRSGLPPASSPAEQLALDLEAARLLDVHDAVADLVLAEGVHQAVLGNFERVGATLDAVGRGGFPTEPAVLETPRSGHTLTHRMAIHLRTGLDHTAPLKEVAATPRSMAEPGVNEALAAMLPAPAAVVAMVHWTTPDGAAHERAVSQKDLGLQPLDLLHLLRLQDRAALGELDQRLALHIERTEALRPDTVVTVALTEPVPGAITFFEVAPLVAALRSMITRSRPLRPSDVAPASEPRAGYDDMHADPARPTAVWHTMDTLGTDLAARLAALAPLVADPVANRDAMAAAVDAHLGAATDLLERAARLGVPGSAWGDLDERRRATFGTMLRLAGAVAERWTVRLASADLLLARDDAALTTITDEERVRTLLLAERELTTTPTTPVPTGAAAFRGAIDALRTAFANQLAAVRGVAASTTLHAAIGAADALLPLAPFDAAPFGMEDVDAELIDLFGHLGLRLAALHAEVARRRDAAKQLLDAYGHATTGAARVEALAGAVRALLGDDAVFVPEFRVAAAQGAEWAAAMAWSRTGMLTAHLAAKHEFPVDDWLHGVARVRDKVHDFEQARLLASAFGQAEPDLWPVQLPHRAEPWFGLEWPGTVTLKGTRLLYTAHYPAAFDPSAAQAGLLLDEWVEMVPGDTTTTGVVFHHDSPDSEPPQAMLLVVPPDPDGRWAWDDIVGAVRDAFSLARLRAVEPDRVAETHYAAFLPATVSSATARGLAISANLARNNKLFAHLKVDHA
jgi:hypothetical protein